MLVYGDTNSTLAGALAAAQLRIPVAHVEAGMRSFDRAMPEELNRVLTDHVSDLLLAPSQTAADEPRARGRRRRGRGRRRRHGRRRGAARAARARRRRPAARRPACAPASTCSSPRTAPATSTTRARLALLVDLLLSLDAPVVLPLHPRTRARLEAAGLLDRLAAGAILLPPLGYLAFTSLLTRARAVLTDSGGVQKEAYLAGVPCVTLRDTTEWVETVQAGWNVLVDLDAERRPRGAGPRRCRRERPELYGDGHAAQRVVGGDG